MFMRDCIEQDYLGRFYEDFYRSAICFYHNAKSRSNRKKDP